MWPWEHAAVGYVCYSIVSRLLSGEPPDGDPVLALAVGTQFPDVVDKTLSWGLGVFPTGYAAGHSVLVSVPVGVALVAAAARGTQRRVAVAFVFGHWSHVATDVLVTLRGGGDPEWGIALWPIVDREPYGDDLGLGRGLVYFAEYLADVARSDVQTLLVVHLGLTALTVALWLVDGAPGLHALGARVRWFARTVRSR
ncbi:metal-dependent hydrolase [Halorubellus sp. JP-L1]|uniref:metal-dependent hydrolase n=1 Tax=Halorubellus sp. JP-L1 TaxID=2715753 RepID=UPI00140851DA|nr:metal-dependent hydrolase [Halorubellus sp. JP-L1]NHN43173.1 metal-dependent hydrolase [Halorubellus sp. JP-L1]